MLGLNKPIVIASNIHPGYVYVQDGHLHIVNRIRYDKVALYVSSLPHGEEFYRADPYVYADTIILRPSSALLLRLPEARAITESYFHCLVLLDKIEGMIKHTSAYNRVWGKVTIK